MLDAIKDKRATTIVKILICRFSDIGYPHVLQSDNGKEYNNQLMSELAKEMWIQHRYTTPYHPRGNGVTENSVKTACNMIRKMIDDKSHNWDKRLPYIQLAMNTRIVHLYNSSPFFLFLARKVNSFCNYTDDK